MVLYVTGLHGVGITTAGEGESVDKGAGERIRQGVRTREIGSRGVAM